MKYMLLIYADEQSWTEAEREFYYGEYLTPELIEREQRLRQQSTASQ